MRRLLIAAFVLAAATPALAQRYDPDWVARDAELRARQDMLRNRTIDLENQLTGLEMRLQTDRALRDLEAQSRRPEPTPPVARPGGRATSGELGGFTSIPDSRLDASNARVRAASRPGR